jgi:signal-transduction protein with cAMP-binding, CBS, and nucleotidyltransferase domain
MTSPVLTVAPDDSAADVAEAMRDAGANSVVIIDDNCHPTGILTSTDYVTMTANAVNPHETTVETFATTDIVTTGSADSVTAAAETMLTHDISHLPIVDEDEQVVGIITTTDLTEYLAEQSET